MIFSNKIRISEYHTINITIYRIFEKIYCWVYYIFLPNIVTQLTFYSVILLDFRIIVFYNNGCVFC